MLNPGLVVDIIICYHSTNPFQPVKLLSTMKDTSPQDHAHILLAGLDVADLVCVYCEI